MQVSVIVVGDEILAGHVQDANAHFIAARVAAHGHRIRRVAVVPDDPADIADELARDLAGPVSLVFVCGGLGPTHDDRTMDGVAAGLGVSLEPCKALSDEIERIADRIGGAGFTGAAFGMDGLRKMALAPAGAEALVCSIGVIPAVAVHDERATVVILPGPPRELQAVFTECVEARFLEGTGEEVWRDEITHPFPESVLAAKLTEIQDRYGATVIGSYPQADHVLIRIAGPAEEAKAAADQLRAHLSNLEASDEGRRLLDYIDKRQASAGSEPQS